MLVAGGALDELCLTWSPLAVGGVHPRILNGPPVDQSWQLGHLLEQDGVLIGRWVADRCSHSGPETVAAHGVSGCLDVHRIGTFGAGCGVRFVGGGP